MGTKVFGKKCTKTTPESLEDLFSSSKNALSYFFRQNRGTRHLLGATSSSILRRQLLTGSEQAKLRCVVKLIPCRGQPFCLITRLRVRHPPICCRRRQRSAGRPQACGQVQLTAMPPFFAKPLTASGSSTSWSMRTAHHN